MNEQLIVKNFGPIKDATVDFKRVTVFIGPTGGGKSTLAKLAAVFQTADFWGNTLESRRTHFEYYSINNYFQDSTVFEWRNNLDIFRITNSLTQYVIKENNAQEIPVEKSNYDLLKKINSTTLTEEDLNDLRRRLSNHEYAYSEEQWAIVKQIVLDTILGNVYSGPRVSTYFPSNRLFIPSVEYSWPGLLRDDIGLPKDILDFANNFSISRPEVQELDIPFLLAKYIHINGQDFIKISNSEILFRIYETASGIQSVVPMLVLLEYYITYQKQELKSFIIEEPELNLYPTAQQGLINWLVEKCTKGENDLTITTHSPYILSHLNLLLYAYQVAEQHPDRADEVAKIVPRESWINPKEFTCYHVEGQKENGVYSIVNPETGLISYNMLDAIAGAESSEFEKLLDINAGLEVE